MDKEEVRLMCNDTVCPNCKSTNVMYNTIGASTYICNDCGLNFCDTVKV